MARINPKHQKFADEYLIDCSATHAAIRAGYSPKTAGQIGYQLLQYPSISAYIKEKTQSIAERLGITAEYTLRAIKQIGDHTLPSRHESSPAVSLKAFETLGKHLKLFEEDDKKQQTININIVQF